MQKLGFLPNHLWLTVNLSFHNSTPHNKQTNKHTNKPYTQIIRIKRSKVICACVRYEATWASGGKTPFILILDRIRRRVLAFTPQPHLTL
jgi:hypothetical protein